jgi:hypothetical protein
MNFGQLMAFVRERFASDPRRNGSILKQLWKRYGPQEVEVMVKGAALLGWKDLRGLWSKEGIGRRWAQTAYWNREKKAPAKQTLESVAATLKARGF